MPRYADPDIIRKKLDSLSVRRRIATGTLPENYAVVVYARNLRQAAEYFRQYMSGKPPRFLVKGKPDPKLREIMAGLDIREYSDKEAALASGLCIFGLEFSVPERARFLAQGNFRDYLMAEPLYDSLRRWWTRKAFPDHIERRMAEIATIYNALADEESKECYLAAIKGIVTGDPSYIPVSKYPHYFHPRVPFKTGAVVIEGGVASGDVTKKMARLVGSTGKIIGFEPLEQFYREATQNVAELDNVIIEPYGLYSKKEEALFTLDGESSRIINGQSGAKKPSQLVNLVDIDGYVNERSLKCDIIKLDIEGAEMECLKGARQTLDKYRPNLAISLYHHSYHYLDIPLWIMENFPRYNLYVQHHSVWYHETCLYATMPGNSS